MGTPIPHLLQSEEVQSWAIRKSHGQSPVDDVLSSLSLFLSLSLFQVSASGLLQRGEVPPRLVLRTIRTLVLEGKTRTSTAQLLSFCSNEMELVRTLSCQCKGGPV